MRFSISSFVVAALSVQQALSIPFDKRAATSTTSTNDTDILQFALTLEHLEVAFYTLALQQFSQIDFIDAGYTPTVFRRFMEIRQHEEDHVALLTAALGDEATQACNYTFPIPEPRSFAFLSEVFENVGAAAYAGAISSLTNPENTAASASILGTEIRQATWLSTNVNEGVPWDSSFQTSLTMRQAFTAASGFIESCPASNPKLGLNSFPAFNLTGAFPGETTFPGENATVQIASNLKATHIAFLFGLTPTFVPIVNDMSKFLQMRLDWYSR